MQDRRKSVDRRDGADRRAASSARIRTPSWENQASRRSAKVRSRTLGESIHI